MAEQKDKAKGVIKEKTGRFAGDEEMESEGRQQRAEERTKEKVEEARDKLKGVTEGLKEKFKGEDH